MGSGKSTVSRRLAGLGAAVIDADEVAREVVEPGKPALTAIRERFGDSVIRDDGSLDRACLAAMVFPDAEALAALEAITGPAITDRIARLREGLRDELVSVFDMPLLVERGLWVHEHVTIVVEADAETRVRRLVAHRGLDEADVRHRMAAQATDAERREVADVVLDNSGPRARLVAAVDRLWAQRLAPWNANLLTCTRTRRPDGCAVIDPRDDWGPRGARVVARLAAALAGEPVTGVEHIGSTSVPGLIAKDVIDVQVGIRSLEAADTASFRAAMRDAGYLESVGNVLDTPHPTGTGPAGWAKRFYGGCDPAQIVHVHVRETGSAGWRFALLFRAWLRASPSHRDDYAREKRRLLAQHDDTDAYTRAKEPWFDKAWVAAQSWSKRVGWTPPAGGG
ncbi:MAG: dephospho-CoA kinase [Micrococcales bacterium]|nr:dephospho-CoA kinase [Micrococcales bacterium]